MSIAQLDSGIECCAGVLRDQSVTAVHAAHGQPAPEDVPAVSITVTGART
jgi:hypothetical protein